MGKTVDIVEDTIQTAILTPTDNISTPRIELTVVWKLRLLGETRPVSERTRTALGITTCFQNVTERNNTSHVLDMNDETRIISRDEMSDLSGHNTFWSATAQSSLLPLLDACPVARSSVPTFCQRWATCFERGSVTTLIFWATSFDVIDTLGDVAFLVIWHPSWNNFYQSFCHCGTIYLVSFKTNGRFNRMRNGVKLVNCLLILVRLMSNLTADK